MRVSVVGAGIYGATAALELARRGHDVVLVDQGPVPHPDAASTDLSKLVRPDYGDDAFLRDLMLEALPIWRDWNTRFTRPLFHEVGLHVLASDWSPGGFEHDSFAHLSTTDAFDDIRARSARWGQPMRGYRSIAAGWAESGAVVAEVVRWCREAGVDVRTETTDVPDADMRVLAPGAWLPVVWPELADRVSAIGQPVFHFAPEDPERFAPPHFLPWCCDIANTGWYGFPANADGIVKVANHGLGYPTDPLGPRSVPEPWEHIFRTFLRVHVPELAEAPIVGKRLCLYADTFDGDFFITKHPTENVVFAGGGSGHGFKFAPVLGTLTANAVEGVHDPRLARFAWRVHGEPHTEQARYLGDDGGLS